MVANTKVELPSGAPGGERIRVKDGGEIVIENGGKIVIEDGGTVSFEAGSVVEMDGVDLTDALADAVENPIAGLAAGLKIAAGQHETVAASDEVDTGLAEVHAVVACFDDDPTADPVFVSASIGDQAGSPDAGKVYIKTWKPTNADTDITPIAATTFGKKVNWIALGE